MTRKFRSVKAEFVRESLKLRSKRGLNRILGYPDLCHFPQVNVGVLL
jgi:hypothetical protein